MNQLDVYYRALVDYRSNTTNFRECVAQRSAVTKVNTESDRITVKRMFCTVEEDWVDAIEAGLIHIEKAINEQRQFIRSNGEVIPIEKVKHVSKDSVEHLAKHSNLIAREIEGEDIIPDHLYTVERLSDYAVYENRFLYMLLCYLRDFITLRYNKILESSNTYDANMTMRKKIKINKRTISYEVNLAEIRKDDEYLRKHNTAKDIIDRIDLLLKAVIAFLATPLMECAAKAPMLKPPITKTNVLKMNNDFKGAMRLYEYVTAYDKPGYSIETKIINLNPFREQLADELAETVLLSSFLTYEYGLDMRDELQKAYAEEEKRRKEEEYQRFLEKLEKVRKKVQKSGQSPEEYILMLEKHIRILEDKCAKLDVALEEIRRLKAELATARERIAELEEELANTVAELAYQKQKYIDDMAALTAAHAEEIRLLNEEHAEEIRQLHEEYAEQIRIINEQHAEEIRELHEKYADEIRQIHETYAEEIRQLNEDHAEEIRQLNEQHAEEIRQLNEAHEAETTRLNAEIVRINEAHAEEIRTLKANHADAIIALENKIAEHEEKMQALVLRQKQEIKSIEDRYKNNLGIINQKHAEEVYKLHEINAKQLDNVSELRAMCEKLEKEKRIMTAQLYALRVEKGVNVSENDFTCQENFDELEHEFNTFKKFYQEEWRKTKKSIRKTVFHAALSGEDSDESNQV